jgi:peptidyl-prolyl cis-trans isomerase D
MLQSLRDNLKGAVAVIVIGLMVVPLVLFGVDSLFVNTSTVQEVAEVNGESITEAELQRAIFFRQNQMRAQFGDNLPEQFISEENLREPVLESLITRRLLTQRVREGGMAVPDEQINQMIVSAPEFQSGGRFDPDLFRQRLFSVGYTPVAYRQQLAQDILLNQHVTGLTASGFVTEQELQRVAALSQQERDFYYLTIPMAPIVENIEVGEDRAKAYYEEHKSEFRNPEQVTIEYLEVNLEEIAENIEIPEEQLREQYAQEVAAFESKVERHAAHILIEPKEDGGEQQILQEIQQRLEGGEDFAELAREYSEDFGSREMGGDLGVTTGDTFPEEFEEALAQLEEGEVSEPVKTDAGWHLIKLLDVEGAEPPTFEQDRARIANALKRAEAQDRFVELTQQLGDVTYNAENLQEAAETLGLERKTAGPFSRDGGFGVASNPEVVETAFSEEVLEQGYTSPVLELGQNHAMVLRVTDHQEPRTLSFEEVETEVERTLEREMAMEKLKEIGQRIEQEVASGKSIEEVALANDYEWQASLNTRRTAPEVDREVLRQAFALPKPKDGAVTSGFMTGAGDYVIVNLTEVTDGNYAEMSETEKQNLRQRLADMAGNMTYSAYEAQLKRTADIEKL